MIICAAVRVVYIDGTKEILCGLRHSDCLHAVSLLKNQEAIILKEQGFINNLNLFKDREEALLEAKACGQICATVFWAKEEQGVEELYSEDLY